MQPRCNNPVPPLAAPGFPSRRLYVPCARLLFMVWSACVTLPAFAQRPPATIPTDRQALLERLPEGYAALAPSRLPSTPARSLAQAQMLLNTSARTGDSRLAARADALLAAFPATDRPPALLYARAFSAQHHHDFLGALVLLDSLIQDNPRDGNARLSRSQVRLVLGRLDQAREDCTALLGIDISDGLLCAASLSLRRGEYTTAGSLVERWLASTIPADGRRRYALVLRAEIAARAGDGDADAWFLRALALDRRDVRTLAAYARYLRGVGRNREVEILLSQDTVSDGLQLQRALASHRVDSARARKLIEAQGARYALAHAVGSEPEMRDEAEFLLTLRRQPDAALVLALKNFESQRDHEDVEILRRAAAAAGRNDVLASLQKWADSQHLKLPPLRVQATP